MFDRAPIEMGRKRGYFKDEAARALLGLNKGDFMQNLGTYGAKEMGTNPVNFDLLRDGTYDQRFLPFVPRLRGPPIVRYLDMRQVNRQWLPSPAALRGLRESFLEVVGEAEKVAPLTNLPLPDYAFNLVPRLLFRSHNEAAIFELQFQPWFDIIAQYARWRQIERAQALLEGYVNAGRLLLNPEKKNWFYSDPIGIFLDPATCKERDRSLALAFSFLALPINCPAEWVIPDNYDLSEARAALLSEGRGSVPNQLSFPTIEELPGNDYDALMFCDVRPNFSERRYMPDGTRLTKQQRKDYDDGESSDMANAALSVNEDDEEEPFPSKITEVMEDVQPTGEPASQPLENMHLAVPDVTAPSKTPTLQLNVTDSLTPPVPTSTPTSASNSAPNSAISSAISSTSSINMPSSHRRGTPQQWRGRAAR